MTLNYGWTRHFQRYEYPVLRGWLNDKTVMDVGCGTGYGANILADGCKKIVAVDNSAVSFPGVLKKQHETPGKTVHILTFTRGGANVLASKLVALYQDIYDIQEKVDVCLAIEIFEHVSDPRKFISHLSTLCNNLFITTPLSKVTTKTDNPSHVAEYSREDFQRFVTTKFDILEAVDQLSTMEMVVGAEPCGSSMSADHVVQMLWCKKKENHG